MIGALWLVHGVNTHCFCMEKHWAVSDCLPVSTMAAKPHLKPSKFDNFCRSDFTYTTIRDHELKASVLTPRKALDHNPSALPVVVFWHGGGFVTGDRMYEPWFPLWMLQFADSTSAMIVSPDYRLLPEATLVDVCDDMSAFWTWFLESFPSITQAASWNVQPDLNRIVCIGQSAGGCIAIHSALDRPDVNIRAVVSLHGPLVMVSELKTSHPRIVGGVMPPPPRQAEAKIRAYIALTKGNVRTVGNPVDMWELVTCFVQQGWMPRLVSRNAGSRADTLSMLKNAAAFPPLWVVHARDDSVVR